MEEGTIDDSNRKIGSSSESNTTAIAGKLVSRSFTFGDIGVKSWRRGQVGANTGIEFRTDPPPQFQHLRRADGEVGMLFMCAETATSLGTGGQQQGPCQQHFTAKLMQKFIRRSQDKILLAGGVLT